MLTRVRIEETLVMYGKKIKTSRYDNCGLATKLHKRGIIHE